MNIYLIAIIIFLLIEFAIETISDVLNLKNVSYALPDEFKGVYDSERYKKSQMYLKDNTVFGITQSGFFIVFLFALIFLKFFGWLDDFARKIFQNEIGRGIFFIGVFFLVYYISFLPFKIYRTFVIEEKYGFNRTSKKTFLEDRIKEILITLAIGIPVLSLLIWFFRSFGSNAWIISWLFVFIVEVILYFIAPIIILPLFNKFIPLEEGELKKEIENYAKSQKFELQGIYKIDASKRTSKTNAYFTGFGKNKRIALFDTLINRLTVEELTSVLAHEIGHYKKKHIIKQLVISFFFLGVMFFIMSFFLKSKALCQAFGVREPSIYAGMLFFGFLYSPVNFIFSIFTNYLSRKYEYEADEFAVKTYKKPEAFINALKKLSVDNLSNLQPHKVKVFLEYTHPPVLDRIKRIRQIVN